jgi:SAM-dependent methyltransferase
MPRQTSRIFGWARRYARRPAIRKVAEPVAGRIYGLRNRRLDARSKWRRGATWEVAHWDDDWLEDARRQGRLEPDRPLTDPLLLEGIARLETGRVRILDVGAGPVTPVGTKHPDCTVELIACDALAEQYDELLARAGVIPPVRTVHGEGEQLVEAFGANSFDIVHCGNALDHHHNPFLALDQMLAVTRVGGLVLLNHYVDEGEFRHYLGMHQWNINERDGQLIIWNREHTEDINDRLAGQAVIECRSFDPGDGGRVRLQNVVTKVG